VPHAFLRALCLAAVAAGLIVLGSHAAAYFFLFDDFALVGQASRWPLHDVLATPLFGFYRPALFLVVRIVYGVFGWQLPQGYAFLVVGLHALNAFLVGRLARRIAGGAASWMAGALFLLSPWSAEAFFWLSGGFDVLATSASLIALLAGLAAGDPGRGARSRGVHLAACAVAALVAVSAKESAVVLPALFVCLWAAQPVATSWRRMVAPLALTCAAALVYLAARSQVVTTVGGGAYGDLASLVRGADVASNLGSHVRALFVWLAPHDALMRTTGLAALMRPLGALALAGFAAAAMTRPRPALALAGAIALCAAPVVWLGLPAGSSSGGRVLYLAGAPFAILVALGAARLLEAPRSWARGPALGAVAIVLVTAVTSLYAQRAMWAEACRLSRQTVEAFRPFVGQQEPLHLDNLPFWFEEGPYVIKSYAFGYYFHPARVPPVTATGFRLVFVDGRARVTTREPEPGGPPTPPAGRRVTLPIDVR
jgi:hypothetical protein